MLLATNVNEVSYATTATPEKFWSKWTEQFADKNAEELYRYKLAEKVNEKRINPKMFSERYSYVRTDIEKITTRTFFI